MPSRRLRTFPTLAAVFGVALIARAAFTLTHGPAPLIAEMNAYWAAAGRLLAGDGFHAGHGFRAFIPPGYVWFLAAVRALGGSPLAARVAHAFLGAATAALVFLYGRRAFNDKVAGFSAFAFALWPASLVFGDFLLTETLFTFLFMAGLLAWGDGSSWKNAFAAGLCWGAAALTRELALYFFPFFALSYILTKRLQHSLKAIVAFLIVIACVAPWTLRNYRVLGGFVPVTTKSAVDLFIYNHNNFDQIVRNESDQPSERQLFADAPDELELAKLARRRALSWITSHPALFLFKGLRTEMNFFGLERDFFQHQKYGYYGPLPKPVLILLVPLFLIPSAAALPLAFVAALRFGGNRYLQPGIYVTIFYIITTFVAYSFTRQRYPLTPVMVTLAVAAVVNRSELRRWLKRRRAVLATALAFIVFLAASWALELYLDIGDYF